MTGILVIGAGGHGKVVADILQMQGVDVSGFLDDDSTMWNAVVLGLPVLGAIHHYSNFSPSGLVMGVGSNISRKQIVERLGEPAGKLWVNAIHPKSTIARSVKLGRGVVVAAGVVINPDTQIGDHAIINTSSTVDHDCTIASYCHVAPGVHVAGAVAIGVGALLGIGSSIIPGCSVGDWVIVGAGASVINNIPEGVTAIGTPACWRR